MQHSIVNLQDISGESTIFRLDSEFFHPKILKKKKTIRSKAHSTLRKMGATIIHPSEVKREYEETGIQILLAQNIRDNFMDFSVKVFMSKKLKKQLKKNKLEHGDIALTRSGANYGQCAPYLGLPLEIFACADDLVIRDLKIPGTYLSTYLNTSFGKNLIESCKYGGSQPHISPQTLYDIPIYTPSDNLISKIDSKIKNLFELRKKSEAIYHQAQTLLLSELGLANWQPKHRLAFVRKYSDTQQAWRMDAEYFQPKYDDIINAIKSYSGGWDTLGSLVKIKKCIEVGSKEYLDEGIPFVRVSNLSPFGITKEKYISEALYVNIQKHQPKQGEILFSKDATPGIAYYLREQPKKMIPSGGILRLKSKTDKINNEYLTLVLNSTLTKEQVNRDVGGSVILHWRPDQVQGTVIPILSPKKQAQIQQKITESFNLRKKSRHLLECAKRAVEMAIEQDEQTAIDWLKNETRSIEIQHINDVANSFVE